MFWAGYNRKDRTIVASRIIAKQDNDHENLIKEDRSIYRSKKDRKYDLKQSKSTWSRNLGATTTLTVPTGVNMTGKIT